MVLAIEFGATSCWSTQHGTGGSRSVGPMYIEGRSRMCSSGVLRLYVSSIDSLMFELSAEVDFIVAFWLPSADEAVDDDAECK